MKEQLKKCIRKLNSLSEKAQELLDLVYKFDNDLKEISPNTWARIEEINDEIDPETFLDEFYIEDFNDEDEDDDEE